MNKNVVRWGSLALIIIILIIFSVLSQRMNEPEMSNTGRGGRTQRTLNVDVAVVKPAEMHDVYRAFAELLPDEEVNLTFETQGKITELNIVEGSVVRKGDLLAKVNDAPLRAELKRYEAQLQLATDRVARQGALLEQDAVSKEVYETTVAELDQLKANIELVQANIARTELRAPFDGVIGLRFVSPGAYANTSTVVATLTKDSPLKVEFSISESLLTKIRTGDKINFTTTYDDVVHEASIYAVESSLDSNTRTLTVRALYPNGDRKLKPKSYVNVSVLYQEFADALSVPGEALVPSMGKEQLYLYRSGKAVAVDVKSGIQTGTRLQILEGIEPGDTVVATGLIQIREGMSLEINRVIE